jgi:hypothetical protein
MALTAVFSISFIGSISYDQIGEFAFESSYESINMLRIFRGISGGLFCAYGAVMEEIEEIYDLIAVHCIAAVFLILGRKMFDQQLRGRSLACQIDTKIFPIIFLRNFPTSAPNFWVASG